MLTAFLWLKTLCKLRFDGSNHYGQSVSMV